MNTRNLLAVFAAAFLAACAGMSPSAETPTLYTSIHDGAFANLKPGTTTKEEVRKQIGIPLTESHFPRLNEDVWEYRYIEGTSLVMLAYVHFDAGTGVLKSYDQLLDPAFHGGGNGM